MSESKPGLSKRIYWLVVLLLAFGATAAESKRKKKGSDAVAKRYSGKIVITTKQPPVRFKSNRMFLRFIKKHRKQTLWTDKRRPNIWAFQFMAFLRRPANDVELRVKFFDVTAVKRFVAGDSIYTSDRGERIIFSKMTLERPPFKAQRKYQMYVTDSRNVVLAKTTFWLKAPKQRYSPNVNFSDEEA